MRNWGEALAWLFNSILWYKSHYKEEIVRKVFETASIMGLCGKKSHSYATFFLFSLRMHVHRLEHCTCGSTLVVHLKHIGVFSTSSMSGIQRFSKFWRKAQAASFTQETVFSCDYTKACTLDREQQIGAANTQFPWMRPHVNEALTGQPGQTSTRTENIRKSLVYSAGQCFICLIVWCMCFTV